MDAFLSTQNRVPKDATNTIEFTCNDLVFTVPHEGIRTLYNKKVLQTVSDFNENLYTCKAYTVLHTELHMTHLS